MNTQKKILSLNKRIALIPCSVFIPMLLVVIYLVVTLLKSADAYSAITESVSYANFYSKEFKERMDYSMYLAFISNKTTEELGDGKTTVNGVVTVDPYKYIDELSGVCDELSDMATASINKKKIIQVNNSLKSLRKCVTELERMIMDSSSTYEEKQAYWDENISGNSGLTQLIQGALQEYVYNETKNFEAAKNELRKKTGQAVELTVFALCITVVIVAGLSVMTVQSVTRPIKKLCSQTRKVARGDFTAKTKIETVDEIAVLTDSFNDMTAEIGILVEDIKKKEKNLRMTESKLMQAQINPHFLYNTLDTIMWLAEEKKTDDVVTMVNSLSEFFRTTLSRGKDYITVKEEKSHVESYLEIQQFRYQDIMDFEIDMAEEIYPYMIPKLTLQPLVENALYHGIKKKRGKGLIRITGWKDGGRIYIKVSDNGIGMSREALDKLRRSTYGIHIEDDEGGFGLANVNQRLHIESVGINATASRLVGLNSTMIKFLTYVICGFMAGIAGLIASSRIYSADANNIGLNLEMDAILAVALGGNVLGGGKFSLMGSVIGAYTIQALTTTLYAMNVSADQLPVYKAIVVVVIVTLQSPVFKKAVANLKIKRSTKKLAAEGGNQ